MSWSEEDTARVRTAYNEALEFMDCYAEEEVLGSAFFMPDGRIPDPDSVIQSLHKLARTHLNNMIFSEEAEHTTTKGPNETEVTLHHVKSRNWFYVTVDITEKNYTPDNITWGKWVANNILNKAREDRNNGKLNHSNVRQNITWDYVIQAVAKIDAELIINKSKYYGRIKTFIFTMIVEELNTILRAKGIPTIGVSTFNRRIEEMKRKRQDVFDLFSDEAMKIIKNI